MAEPEKSSRKEVPGTEQSEIHVESEVLGAAASSITGNYQVIATYLLPLFFYDIGIECKPLMVS